MMVAINELGFIAVLPTMIAPLAVNQGIAEIVSLKRAFVLLCKYDEKHKQFLFRLFQK